jgi:NADPH-dependent 2,4-dienoyl-CoA reductase/sulfur reductase-like enzyme
VGDTRREYIEQSRDGETGEEPGVERTSKRSPLGTAMVSKHSEAVIIVGAGCFGISTAYHLLQRGYTDVTVLDRSVELPAPDAASTDINKGE